MLKEFVWHKFYFADKKAVFILNTMVAEDLATPGAPFTNMVEL